MGRRDVRRARQELMQPEVPKLLYEAYSRAVGGHSYRGDRLPYWHQLARATRAAWRTALMEVSMSPDLIRVRRPESGHFVLAVADGDTGAAWAAASVPRELVETEAPEVAMARLTEVLRLLDQGAARIREEHGPDEDRK